MSAAGKSGKKATASKQSLSLSDQAHQQILDYLRVASENSGHPEIRDAAIDLAKNRSTFQQKQTARLSPTLTLLACLLILGVAGVSCWYFYINYRDVAPILSMIVIGLALVGVCLFAMFAGQLSQANFVVVTKLVWSKISGILSRSREHTIPDPAEQDSRPSQDEA